MIFVKLLITFIKIGLFSFGGGYAMIPLIQKEIETNQWLSSSEFVDIIAIAEMTPGPIAVNSATFVGYKTAGIMGGVIATIGVSLPSLILVLLISKFFFKFQNHPFKNAMFYGIRPVITGLIITAAIFIAETSIFKEKLSISVFNNMISNPTQIISFGSLAILGISLLCLIKYKLHPILVIIGSACLGIVLFYFI